MSKNISKKVTPELVPEISDNSSDSEMEITITKNKTATKKGSDAKTSDKKKSSSDKLLSSSESEAEAPVVAKKKADKKVEKKPEPKKEEVKKPAPKKEKKVLSDSETSDAEMSESEDEKKPEPQHEAVTRISELREQLKTVKTFCDTAEKELKTLEAVFKKNVKNRKKREEKDVSITAELAKVLGIDAEGPYKKSEIVSKMSTFVNEKGLQDPNNKSEFKLDAKLKKLFNTDLDVLKKININKYITPHIVKKDE
jgi:chromatin remodeling complex protein RSC6